MLPREGAPATGVALPAWSGLAWCALILCLTLIGEAFSKGLWVGHLWSTELLAVLLLALFILAERRGPPLFDYSMFRITAFRMGAQGAVMVSVIVFIVTLLMPFYLEVYLGVPLARIGLLLGMAPLCSMFFGPIAGHVADRLGYRLPDSHRPGNHLHRLRVARSGHAACVALADRRGSRADRRRLRDVQRAQLRRNHG